MNQKPLAQAEKVCAEKLLVIAQLYADRKLTVCQLAYAGCAMSVVAMVARFTGEPVLLIALNAFSGIAVLSSVAYSWWARRRKQHGVDAAARELAEAMWAVIERELDLERQEVSR